MLRVTNPVVRLLLRSPVGGPMRRQFMVLRFTGRKTGRRYDIPVVAHRLGDELCALTDARGASTSTAARMSRSPSTCTSPGCGGSCSKIPRPSRPSMRAASTGSV